MSFQIVRNDITQMEVDAIVNTANRKAGYSTGTDSAVYHAAGVEQLLKARMEIGDLRPGEVAVTYGYDLPADYIIHAIGTSWRGGGEGECAIMAQCYSRSLAKAVELQCRSIAIPLLGSGNFGFPRSEALAIAMQEIRQFLTREEIDIYLVVYDEQSARLTGNLFGDLESYIDDNYVDDRRRIQEDTSFVAGVDGEKTLYKLSSRIEEAVIDEEDDKVCMEMFDICEEDEEIPRAKMAAGRISGSIWKQEKKSKRRSLDDLGDQLADSFADTLQRLIDERGLENPQVYTWAYLSKQTFHKIINGYSLPKKNTILILAVSMKLSLDETIDLLAKAGHALSPSSLQDMVMRYFLENEIYDWEEIDEGFLQYNLTPLVTD